jgi:diguanylate cyclase (GGDEF)-like protein/PAS domain S-box-containing protein
VSPLLNSPRRELFPRGRRHHDVLPRELPNDLAMLATGADAALVLRGPVITNASPTVRNLFGWDPRLCVGRTMREVFDDGWTAVSSLQDAASAEAGQVAMGTNVELEHVDGRPVWVDVMVADRQRERVTLVLFTDVTDRHDRAARLGDPNNRDTLTQLPNRSLFLDLVEEAIARADSVNRATATLVVDIRGLATINDAYGWEVGNQVLQTVGQRLLDVVRADDHVGRVGDDEFAVLLDDLDPDHPNDVATDVSGRLLESLATPLQHPGLSEGVRVRIGFAVHMPPNHRAAGMLERATARTSRDPISSR